MEENQFQFPIPTSSNVATDITKNSTIVEEGPRICPLCNSIVRRFYINYSATILMCENLQCEYPFGGDFTIDEGEHEDANFLADLDFSVSKGKQSTRSGLRSSTRSQRMSTSQSQGTGSELSTSEWSELGRLSHAYDSDDSVTSTNIFTKRSTRSRLEKRIRTQENEDEKIKKNVEQIKQLNKVLFEAEEDGMDTIRNEQWIKNLSSMQSGSGMKLVKEQELKKLKKQDDIALRELKIDIDSRQDSMSSIVIEIGNVKTNTAGKGKKEKVK